MEIKLTSENDCCQPVKSFVFYFAVSTQKLQYTKDFFLVLYQCEPLCAKLREENGLWVFRTRIYRKTFRNKKEEIPRRLSKAPR